MGKSKKRQLENEGSKESKKAKGPGHWSAGLLDAMSDPNLKIREDDKVVIINDKYPKAKFHFLVLPKEDISSLKKVKKEHLNLLKHMSEVGNELAKQHPDVKFKCGYHSQASMSRLHLHVISDDFNTLCVKTKKHWNSFTSKFFLPDTDVIQDVEQNGTVTLKSEEECKQLLSLPLKCNKCKFSASTMPSLKNHLFENHGKIKTSKATNTKLES